ncbi:4-galactosyl-N-acetylglucosaminide 3-alpha-L-fucosyltransferase FUT6-like isoform X2 [Pararge aegeria]|uniref:4-galactosyl-N-acetylglucosaminide 3-alpha-L-fucosyltransferase FUT6-like isoform X2 n=1 Tax=Pararge aegeria TaxID=116150 RepID=UPI0019D0F438|nr:4-galactosyl-N-acetylglucosaminide 3-alpha-L-fucosyltransferase FUT6-like isoform X2 [Pararge aegeria]
MRYLSTVLKRFFSFNTLFIILLICLLLLLVYKPEIKFESIYKSDMNRWMDVRYENTYRLSNSYNHEQIVDLYYEKRQNWRTSNLGSILFQNNSRGAIKYAQERQNRTFVVLIWKYWKWLVNRHVNSFSSKRLSEPLTDCSVKNCKFTGNDGELLTADAVVIHIQRGLFPNETKRNSKQRWIFLSDESPVHSFSMAKNIPELARLADVFNWSMTYSDSDVPVPYGRTIPLQKPILSGITADSLSTLVPYWDNKRTDILVTILISNCGVSRRMDYLKRLEEYLTVDVYGKCSLNHKNSCPGHFRADCKLMSEYLFYLVFENSQCDEYLTEKSFYHAYSKGAIPVIMGPSIDVCEKLLPPDSFLHVDSYENAQKLAYDMIKISQDETLLLKYHRWRNDFAIANEHGYFGSKSYHLCRICEALNFNDDKEKVYDENSLRQFLDPSLLCRD